MTSTSLPAGFRAVPLDEAPGPASWPLCLIVREVPAGGVELVVLHNLPDCRAFLGCVCDAEQRVREWIELWVQNLEDFSSDGSEDDLASPVLDRRWQHHWRATRFLAPSSVVLEVPPEQAEPLWLDPKGPRVVRPTLPGGGRWRLCREDGVLAANDLPPYSRSTRRFLVAEDSEGSRRFVATGSAASSGGRAQPGSAEQGFEPAWLSVNPQGAPMAALLHPLLDFEDYVDLLGGSTIAEVAARKLDFEAAILPDMLGLAGRDGRRHGLLLGWNNPIEIFYLKLRLLCQAGRALLAHLREQQAPLLNLDPASFGVFVQGVGDLPWPWTTTCVLVRPGRAIPHPIPEASEVRFVAVGDSGAPAYCPTGAGRRSDVNVTVRLLRAVADQQQRVSLEGTLMSSSPVPLEASDIVRLRLPHGRITGEFHGVLLLDGPGMRREIQFRTWARALEPRDAAQLRQLEGGKLERCWSEFIPVLSSPYDLNSLSVLGARALLCPEQKALPEVLAALERLGRAVGEQLPAEAGFPEIAAAVHRKLREGDGEPRLAPNRLLGSLPDKPPGTDWLPAPLWAEAIAVLLRLMPGLGPVSLCADYGSAPTGALHLPLEEPLSALESLCARARSLVFSDWNANREMREVLAELKTTP